MNCVLGLAHEEAESALAGVDGEHVEDGLLVGESFVDGGIEGVGGEAEVK